jgi:phosphoglycolate phosphatase
MTLSGGAFDLALFDLDGTLVDTALDLGGAANRVRADLGLPPLPDEPYRPVASAGARGLLRVALGLTPEHADFAAHREAFLRYYRAHLTERSKPFAGIPELLSSLERSGRRWGVVTNKPSFLTDPLMQELGLDSRAACMVSADQAGKPKPAPDSLELALKLTGVAPEHAIYVGDDKRDIDAAKAAGLRSIAAGWGYISPDVPITDWGADAIAVTVSDLTDLLR